LIDTRDLTKRLAFYLSTSSPMNSDLETTPERISRALHGDAVMPA
jgi:hypothetical protein